MQGIVPCLTGDYTTKKRKKQLRADLSGPREAESQKNKIIKVLKEVSRILYPAKLYSNNEEARKMLPEKHN